MFRVRLDEKSGLNVPEYIDSIGATTYVLVHHVLPHGNPHYHAFIQTDIKEQTFRQRIKRLGYSASDFSIKKCQDTRKDEYIQYLFNQKHGNKSTLIKSHNFDDQLLLQLQSQAQSVADEFASRHEAKQNTKPTIFQFSQEVREELENRFTRHMLFNHREMDDTPFPQIYQNALEIAIKICHKYNQPFEEHYLKRIVTTALSYLQTGKQGIVDKIMRKEFS